MRKVISILVLVLFSTLALITFAQDDAHEDENCTVDSLLEHIEEYRDAFDALITSTDNDTETILETVNNIGNRLGDLAEGCGYHSDDEHSESATIDPHSIGEPENGEVLFNTLIPEVGFACSTCHRVDSTETLIGPGLLTVGDPSHDPNAHSADDADMDMDADHDADDTDAETDMDMGGMNMGPVSYIYTSITDPSAFVVDGFVDNLMPQTYAEIYTEDEINDLIAYLVSLSIEAGEEHDD